MSTNNTSLLFLYEPAQVPLALERIRNSLPTVVALDYEVELELKKLDIPFVSIADISRSPEDDKALILETRRMAREWYTHKSLSFFSHDNILLGEPEEGMFLYYVQALVYYTSVISQALSHFSEVERVSVFEPLIYVPPTADSTAVFKERLVPDMVELLAKRAGLVCERIAPPQRARATSRLAILRQSATQLLAHVSVSVSNTIVGMCTRPRPIVLFATDPWSRIEPFIKQMSDVELVMSRRAEARTMGLSAIFTHRVRFHHRLDFATGPVRTIAKAKAQEFKDAWAHMGDTPAIADLFVYQGISLWPVVKPVLEEVVLNRSEDTVAAIESAKNMLRARRVNCILLLASTKGDNNLLAHMGKSLGIPTIELQHALELTDPTNPHSRLHTDYLAAYGPLARERYETFGADPESVVPCGSPRFDKYSKPIVGALPRDEWNLKEGEVACLVAMPPVYLSLEPQALTTYGAHAILQDLSEVQRRHPNLFYALKLRPWAIREEVYRQPEVRNLFSERSRLYQYEDIHPLLASCDLVISGSSTVVIEAMIMGKPVITYLPKRTDLDFQVFEDAGVIRMARTHSELMLHADTLMGSSEARRSLAARASDFLANNFLFDGDSATRIAALIRRVVQPKQ